MIGTEIDPAFSATYRAWLEGGAADEGGEEEGDYSEEEEERINATIAAWKGAGEGNIKKRGRPKGTTKKDIGKMKSQDEDAPERASAISKANEVYKDNDDSKTNHVSQNAIESNLKFLIDKIGVEKAYQLLLFFEQPKRERESRDQLLVNNITTKQLTEVSPGDLAQVVISQYNNCKPFLDVYFQIKAYVEGSKTIEATIIYLCVKKGICYLSVLHKLFPTKNRATIYYAFKRLEAQGIIEVKDKNDGYSDQAKIYEYAIQTRNNRSMPFLEKIVYYGLTDYARTIHKSLISELEKLVPKDIEQKIKERGMKATLYHTSKEQEFQQTQELKRIRLEINEYLKSATILYHYGKDASEVLNDKIAEDYGSEASKNMTQLQFQQIRLSILKELYEEANKRR